MTKTSSGKNSTSSGRASGNRKRERSRLSRVGMGLDLSLRGSGIVVARGPEVLLSLRLPTEPVPDGAVGKAALCGLRERRDGSKVFRGDVEECIEYIRKKVRKTFLKHEPDIVVVENYAFVKNSRALSVLHEVGGVVKNTLHRMEAPLIVPTPSEVKKFATGDGGASKADMLLAARRAGYEFRNSDEADAFWLARYGSENYDELTS